MYKNAGIDTTGIPGLIDRYKGAFVFFSIILVTNQK